MSAPASQLTVTAAVAFVLGAAVAQGCPREGGTRERHIRPNVETDFNPHVEAPEIPRTSYVYEDADVIGSVSMGANVLVAPHAFIRGDEGQHIRIGDDSNIQDCAGIHALESVQQEVDGKWRGLPRRLFTEAGEWVRTPLEGEEGREEQRRCYAVWIGSRVSVAHQALVHGPAWVGDDTFVGMQAQVFNARVGKGCFLAPRAFVMSVDIPDGRLVGPAVSVLTQADADALPPVKGTVYEPLNGAVVHVNTALAARYIEQARRADGEGGR
jgi:carbonic anhydrase/acetyltransferase-like protein (isoleucine patch superfamily)